MIQSNIQEVKNFLDSIQDKIEDTSPIMHTIGEKVVSKTMESFEKEKDPITGSAWKPIEATSMMSFLGGKKTANTKKGFLRKPKATNMRDKRILQDKGIRGGLMGSIDFNADRSSVLANYTQAQLSLKL